MTPSTRQVLLDGLWHRNTGLVALLGLCPLLATSNTLINGLGLGLATTLVLVLTNSLISAVRHLVRAEVRIPAYVLIIACTVTVVELLMHAYWHALYGVLGIFIPLIVTNCCVIGRAEAFAARHPVRAAAVDGLATGLGFLGVLVCLGAVRELLGQGTLFAGAELMFGEAGRALTVQVWQDYRGFLLAILPPGAFFALGGLIAIKNLLDARQQRQASAPQASASVATSGAGAA